MQNVTPIAAATSNWQTEEHHRLHVEMARRWWLLLGLVVLLLVCVLVNVALTVVSIAQRVQP